MGRNILTAIAVVFLSMAVAADKQPKLDPINLDSLTQKIRESRAQLDSINARTNALIAERDSEQMARQMEQMNRNMDAFLREKKEKDEKQVKALWIRGGAMGVMVILLVVNYMRRKKKDPPAV